jgi:hypothetical protein
MYFVVTNVSVQLPVNSIDFLSQSIMLSAHLRTQIVKSSIDVLKSLVDVLKSLVNMLKSLVNMLCEVLESLVDMLAEVIETIIYVLAQIVYTLAHNVRDREYTSDIQSDKRGDLSHQYPTHRYEPPQYNYVQLLIV